jgi:hypothetical protein
MPRTITVVRGQSPTDATKLSKTLALGQELDTGDKALGLHAVDVRVTGESAPQRMEPEVRERRNVGRGESQISPNSRNVFFKLIVKSAKDEQDVVKDELDMITQEKNYLEG